MAKKKLQPARNQKKEHKLEETTKNVQKIHCQRPETMQIDLKQTQEDQIWSKKKKYQQKKSCPGYYKDWRAPTSYLWAALIIINAKH